MKRWLCLSIAVLMPLLAGCEALSGLGHGMAEELVVNTMESASGSKIEYGGYCQTVQVECREGFLSRVADRRGQSRLLLRPLGVPVKLVCCR